MPQRGCGIVRYDKKSNVVRLTVVGGQTSENVPSVPDFFPIFRFSPAIFSRRKGRILRRDTESINALDSSLQIRLLCFCGPTVAKIGSAICGNLGQLKPLTRSSESAIIRAGKPQQRNPHLMPSMAAKRALDLRRTILDKLNEREYQPLELFRQLQSFEISELALKDALADLLEDALIELSPDRHIKLRAHQPIGAARATR